MRRPALALLLGCLLLVAGASALDSYDYYQTIEYAGCDQDIYQQDIVIHRTSGTNYEETVAGMKIWHIYVKDHCAADYGDIIVKDVSGTILRHYLWPDYTSSEGRICVRLEDADASGELVLYYGNPDLVGVSDGDATYLFFDNGSGTNPSEKWGISAGSPTVAYVDGRLRISATSDSAIFAKDFSGGDYTVVAAMDITGVGAEYAMLMGRSSTSSMSGYSFRPSDDEVSGIYKVSSGSFAFLGSGPKRTPLSYHVWEMIFTGSSIFGIYDGENLVTASSTTYPTGSVGFRVRGDVQVDVDYILVRAYSATPPAATTFSGEQETAAPPVTAFTATPAAGLAPLTVQFTDASTGHPTSWLWSFGDGNTSTDQNPQHTYAVPGTYTVTLTATNEYGSTPATKLDYITVYGPITAQFSATPTGGTAPVTVQFTDRSTGGPTSWLWDFGDGTTSTDQNPTHIYTTAGAHTVTLTASHPYDNDTETKPAYIIVAVLQPFPGLANIPRDLAGNGLYTDINGNNRLDYNDLTVFFQHLAWAKTAQPIACFDFNGNGWLDYNDVITLFSTIMEEHT